jgi:hypothetical protein
VSRAEAFTVLGFWILAFWEAAFGRGLGWDDVGGLFLEVPLAGPFRHVGLFR